MHLFVKIISTKWLNSINCNLDDVSFDVLTPLFFYMLKQKLNYKIETNEKTELVVPWLDGKLFAFKTVLIKNPSIFLANNIKLIFVWIKIESTGVVNNSLTYSRNYFVMKCMQCVKNLLLFAITCVPVLICWEQFFLLEKTFTQMSHEKVSWFLAFWKNKQIFYFSKKKI